MQLGVIEFAHDFIVMCCNHNCRAMTVQFFEQVQDFRADGMINVAGGFVGDQQFRAIDDGARNRYTLLLAGSSKRLCTDLVRVTNGRLFPKVGAEAVYAVTHEGALHLDDVLTRRTRVSIETADRGLAGWDGFGLAVQAYQKRAPAVVDPSTRTAASSRRARASSMSSRG